MQQAHPSSGGSHVVFPSISEATSGLMKDKKRQESRMKRRPLLYKAADIWEQLKVFAVKYHQIHQIHKKKSI